MTTWIALLRGINVGGRNKVPMAELRALAASLGFIDPETYIQSGNLVFDAGGGEADVATELEAALQSRFGFPIPVVLRSSEALAAAAAEHPFASLGLEARFLMVAFLDRAPETVIEADAYLPDRITESGRDLYLAYPNGIGRSKLDHALLERRLGVRATIRNWNTVQKLTGLAHDRTM